MRIEAKPPNLVLSDCDADGKCGAHSVVFQYNGKKYSGPADWGVDFTFQKVSARTIEEKDWVAGKDELTETDIYTIADDGKTMIQKVTFAPSKEKRKPATIARSYVRQEGPHSDQEPFIGYWVEDPSQRTPYECTYIKKGDRTVQHTNIHGFTFTEIYDGRDHSVESDDCDAFNSQYVNDKIMARQCKKDGTVAFTVLTTFSDDGSRFTITTKNAKGELNPVTGTFVKVSK
jgi:hypothetical protein